MEAMMRVVGLSLSVLAIALLTSCSYNGEGNPERSWNHDAELNGGYHHNGGKGGGKKK
jgi:hypothetical protein